MLSIKRTKELLNDKDVSDKKAEEIRDGFYVLTEIIFEKWRGERKRTEKSKGIRYLNIPRLLTQHCKIDETR